MTDDEIQEKIVKVVRRHMPKDAHYRVFLFGSRADGTATRRSDFDIGIEGAMMSSEAKANIYLDLEDLPILHKIDFVDFRAVSEKFRKVAGRKVRVLHEQ